jgi:hypothetical protein
MQYLQKRKLKKEFDILPEDMTDFTREIYLVNLYEHFKRHIKDEGRGYAIPQPIGKEFIKLDIHSRLEDAIAKTRVILGTLLIMNTTLGTMDSTMPNDAHINELERMIDMYIPIEP